MVTSAPKEARPLAMAAPMPLAAPVTMAIFPLRSMDLVTMNPSFPTGFGSAGRGLTARTTTF